MKDNPKTKSDESIPLLAARTPFPLAQTLADRSLDQWRGLALILVLFSHGFWETKLVPGVGRVGVNLFFFISGLLVFRSLAKGPAGPLESAKYFWYRRTKRLIPALYFYLLCMLILVFVAGPPLVTTSVRDALARALPSSMLYYRNYYAGLTNEKLTGHLWSVSCEMQFYLLAPIIYFIGGKSTARRMLVYGLILIGLLANGLSVVHQEEFHRYAFRVASWPMMAGFFTQFLIFTFPNQCARWGKTLFWIGILSFLAFIFVVFLKNVPYEKHIKWVVLAGTPLIAGCLGCYLQGTTLRGKVGNFFHWIGNRTYSIYLWQEPLTIGGLMPPSLHPLGSLLSIPLGALSFRFLELPFMSKFRSKKPK